MALSNKVFFDANVLLEVILERQHAKACAAAITTSKGTNAISAVTVHIVHYFAERYTVKRQVVDDALASFEILQIDTTIVTVADRRYDGRDYEDCLQAACAEAAGCSQIVTLDARFAQHSATRLPVVNP